MKDQAHEHAVGAAVAKAAPPVGVTGAHMMGVPVSDLVLWLTLVYLVLQISYLCWKWWRDRRLADQQDQDRAHFLRKRKRDE